MTSIGNPVLSLIVRMTIAAVLILAVYGGAPVLAHTSLAEDTAPANAYFRARFIVAHGCDGSPTHTIRIQLPASVEFISTWHKPGWTVTPVADSKQPEGQKNPVIREVTWTGNSLPANEYDYFEIQLKLPSEAGRTLYFKTIQVCDKGDLRWIEIPEPGKQSTEYEYPAPALTLIDSGP